MKRVVFRGALAGDRTRVVMQVVAIGGVGVQVDVEPPELDELIHTLLEMRSKLKDVVPRSLDPGSRIPSIESPAWGTPATHPAGFRTLVLRHPGAGWTAYHFPEKAAADLAVRFARSAIPALA